MGVRIHWAMNCQSAQSPMSLVSWMVNLNLNLNLNLNTFIAFESISSWKPNNLLPQEKSVVINLQIQHKRSIIQTKADLQSQSMIMILVHNVFVSFFFIYLLFTDV